MLIPATAAAAGSYNQWDIAKLLDEVRAASLRHVGDMILSRRAARRYRRPRCRVR
jgi:hypothetical protein